MARVTAMLKEARTAGLDVQRDGNALVVRGPDAQDSQARALLTHKPLVLAILDHEDECRGHEHAEHLGQSVDWRVAGGRLVCCACHPALLVDQGGGAAGASAGGVDAADQPAGAAACPMCGNAGRCEGRIATPDGGWVCLAAVADGVVRNGRHYGRRAEVGAEGDGGR